MGILRGHMLRQPLPQPHRGFALVVRSEYVELPPMRLVQVCEMERGDGEDLVHQRLVVESQPHELCLPDVAYLASPGQEEASHGAVVVHQLEVRDPRRALRVLRLARREPREVREAVWRQQRWRPDRRNRRNGRNR